MSKSKNKNLTLNKEESLNRMPSDFFSNQIELNFKEAKPKKRLNLIRNESSPGFGLERQESTLSKKRLRKNKSQNKDNDNDINLTEEQPLPLSLPTKKKKTIFAVANKTNLPENKEHNKTLLDFINDTESGIPMKEKENKESNSKRKAKEKESRKSSISYEVLEKKREKETKKEIHNLFKPKIVIENGNARVIKPNYTEINQKIQNDKGYKDGGVVENFERNKLTSMSFRKNKIHSDKWTDQETDIFYKSLAYFGTDFSVLEIILRPRKRNQIKNKFRKEEKKFPKKVENALKKFNPAHIEKFFSILKLYTNNEESYDNIDFHKILDENFEQFNNIDLTNVPDLQRNRSNSFNYSLSSRQVSQAQTFNDKNLSKMNSVNPGDSNYNYNDNNDNNDNDINDNLDKTESDESIPEKKSGRKDKKVLRKDKNKKNDDPSEVNNKNINDNLKVNDNIISNNFKNSIIDLNKKKSDEVNDKSLLYNLFNFNHEKN